MVVGCKVRVYFRGTKIDELTLPYSTKQNQWGEKPKYNQKQTNLQNKRLKEKIPGLERWCGQAVERVDQRRDAFPKFLKGGLPGHREPVDPLGEQFDVDLGHGEGTGIWGRPAAGHVAASPCRCHGGFLEDGDLTLIKHRGMKISAGLKNLCSNP